MGKSSSLWENHASLAALGVGVSCRLEGLSQAMVCFGAVLWLEGRLGRGPLAIGLALGLGAAARLLGGLLLKTLTHLGLLARGRLALASPWAMVLAGAGICALGVVGGKVFLLVLALLGVLASLIRPSGCGPGRLGIAQGEALSRASLPLAASAFVRAAGPLLSGLVAAICPAAVFPVAGVLALASGILLGVFGGQILEEDGKTAVDEASRRKPPCSPAARSSFKFHLWAALAASGFANGGLAAVFPVFAQGSLGLSPLGAGALLALQGAAASAVLWLGCRFLLKSVRKAAPAFCVALIAVAFCAGQTLPSIPSLLGFFVLQGASLGIIGLQTLLFSSCGAVDGAGRLDVCRMVFGLGWAAGAAGGGWAFQNAGWADLAWGFGMAAAALVVVQMLLLQYAHRVEVADYVSHFNDKENMA